MEPRSPLSSVDNALRLLLLLGEGHPLRVTDASEKLGVGRSTAHRLLAMLEYRGFVHQEPTTRAYIAGNALVELGKSIVHEAELDELALPELRSLVSRVRETAHITILRGTNVFFTACVESPEPTHTPSHAGTTFPAHTTASGKVLLAELDDAELRARYAGFTWEAPRRHGIGSWSELRRELAAVRRRGYGMNYEENHHGVHAVGVSIKDDAGRVWGAVAVAGPAVRFRREAMRRAVPEVRRAADRIAARVAQLRST